MAQVWVWHYTTEVGCTNIQNSGVILASSADLGDANGGRGVYVTTVGPENSDETIVRSCWDRRPQDHPSLLPRIQMALGFLLPRHLLARPENAAGRDVLVFRGDLRISDYPCRVVRRY